MIAVMSIGPGRPDRDGQCRAEDVGHPAQPGDHLGGVRAVSQYLAKALVQRAPGARAGGLVGQFEQPHRRRDHPGHRPDRVPVVARADADPLAGLEFRRRFGRRPRPAPRRSSRRSAHRAAARTHSQTRWAGRRAGIHPCAGRGHRQPAGHRPAGPGPPASAPLPAGWRAARRGSASTASTRGVDVENVRAGSRHRRPRPPAPASASASRSIPAQMTARRFGQQIHHAAPPRAIAAAARAAAALDAKTVAPAAVSAAAWAARSCGSPSVPHSATTTESPVPGMRSPS